LTTNFSSAIRGRGEQRAYNSSEKINPKARQSEQTVKSCKK
jgi:hypothetical protein